MSVKYSIDEVLKFAIEIEKEGELFYRVMASKTSNKDMKKLCLKLSDDERKHMEIYENMLEILGPDPNEYIYGMENEYIAYLHAFIEKTVFNDEKINGVIESFNDENTFLKYAIEKEKDSIDYYMNMKNLLTESSPVIDKVIKEEESHIEVLKSYMK